MIGAKGATLNDWETTCRTVIDSTIFLLPSFVVRGLWGRVAVHYSPPSSPPAPRSVRRALYGSIRPSPRTPFLRLGFVFSSRLPTPVGTSGPRGPLKSQFNEITCGGCDSIFVRGTACFGCPVGTTSNCLDTHGGVFKSGRGILWEKSERGNGFNKALRASREFWPSWNVFFLATEQ